jgi:hypothetical protein
MSTFEFLCALCVLSRPFKFFKTLCNTSLDSLLERVNRQKHSKPKAMKICLNCGRENGSTCRVCVECDAVLPRSISIAAPTCAFGLRRIALKPSHAAENISHARAVAAEVTRPGQFNRLFNLFRRLCVRKVVQAPVSHSARRTPETFRAYELLRTWMTTHSPEAGKARS